MKTFVRCAVLLLAVAAMCQAGLALAEDFHWVSSGSQAVADKAPAATNDQSACAGSCEPSCDQCGGGGVFGAGAGGCDDSPERGIVGVFGFDSFKGISDNGGENFGAVTGLNTAMPVPGLSDYGIGWQLGLTYGVYDVDGTVNSPTAKSQQQTFVTTGFYRKGGDDQRLSFGLVYDWMLNSNWGNHGVNPTLGQWRGQVEYALSDINGVGVYASMRDLGSLQWCPRQHLVTDRAISQVNLFWHHKFESAADSWLWVGLPERERLSGHGSLGDWIIGANIQVPISERLALYGNAQYMHPSAAAGATASVESDWNVGAGVVWYFGGHAISHSLNGKCWLPYMPVANNSTFLVDENY